MLHHLPEGFGEGQQLVEEVVAPPEADDVNHPHPLRTEGGVTPRAWRVMGLLPTHPLPAAVCRHKREDEEDSLTQW